MVRERIATEGRRLLHAYVAERGSADVLKRLAISRPHLSNLMSGAYLPSLHLALLIEEELGIPCRCWR